MRGKTNWFKVNYAINIHHPDRLLFSEEALLSMFGYGAVLVQQRRGAAASA